MIRLTAALNAWGTPDFAAVLKKEIQQLGGDHLPLQQGLSVGSYAFGNKLDVMLIAVSDDTGSIRAKVGIFYSGIIAGCSCADDPTPVEEQSEYCEVVLDIDKRTAETSVTLVDE